MKNLLRFILVIFGSGLMQLASAQLSKPVTRPIVQTPTAGQLALKFGRFDLYSGIPSMYLGHAILSADGKYKVALSPDEDTYDVGTFIYHQDTNTVEWRSGMFKNNNWGGKIILADGNMRIQFNKATYAQPK